MAPVAFVVVWNSTAPLFSLPGVMDIVRAVVEMIESGTYLHDILISTYRGLSGFLIGFSLGCVVGFATGRWSGVHLVMGGLLNFLRWTPVSCAVAYIHSYRRTG